MKEEEEAAWKMFICSCNSPVKKSVFEARMIPCVVCPYLKMWNFVFLTFFLGQIQEGSPHTFRTSLLRKDQSGRGGDVPIVSIYSVSIKKDAKVSGAPPPPQ